MISTDDTPKGYYRLSYTLKNESFYLATITDEYYFLDTVYHIVKEILEHSPLSPLNAYCKIDLDLYEYIAGLLAWEDTDMLDIIMEAIYNRVIKILGSEVFAPLLDYNGEILDVQYRYEPRERYVKYYILFKE